VQVLVLAGGLGTRMLPHTAERPKALLPVAGRPFAEHQIELLAANGVRDVVFSIAYRGEMIRDALGDGARWDVRIRYVDEGDDLRGTGGAVRLFAHSGLADDAFAVLYGDSYLPVPYAPVWQAYAESGAPALMTVLENADRWHASNARLEPGGLVRYRKGEHTLGRMTHIDYGLSVLATPTVLARIPRDTTVDLAELLSALGDEGLLAGYEVHERFYEIGSPSGIDDLEHLLSTPDFSSVRSGAPRT
jgi:NDP-sugar pyrophosphorylase family protein